MKHKINQLLSDDGAVSPVIGVILMVAITVILAAVIGTFVLGLGDQVSQTAPQASITVESVESSTAGDVTFKHGGGETLDLSNIEVTTNGDGSSGTASSLTGDFGPADTVTVTTGIADLTTGAQYTSSWVHTPSGQVIAEVDYEGN